MPVNPKVVNWSIQKRGYFDITISGNCMKPLICNGESVRIYPLSPKLDIGDIVLLYSDGKYRLHRIVSLDEDEILTRGDNAEQIDGNTCRLNILGSYVGRNKYKKLIARLSFAEIQSGFWFTRWTAGWMKNLLQAMASYQA